MTLRAHLQRLLKHMEWADGQVWSAVLDVDATRADALTRQRLHHVHTVHWVYLWIWRGEPVDPPEFSAFPDLGSIRDWARDYYGELSGFAESLGAVSLDRPLEFPWADQLAERSGETGRVTLAESVLQVTSHTTHHRGQISARLRRLGGEPPLVDLVAWLWKGRPDPRWP